MITINLADGRELKLEPVAPHEAMSIAEGCRQLSGIRQWWRMAMVAASVRSIDGIVLPLPTHEKHIEGMVSRLSREEWKRISAALEENCSKEAASVLEMEELSSLETLRIWALIGEFETISGWVVPAFIAATVRKIGGEKVVFPTTKDEMKALVARLGNAGMAEASAAMLARREAEKALESDRQAAAKN